MFCLKRSKTSINAASVKVDFTKVLTAKMLHVAFVTGRNKSRGRLKFERNRILARVSMLKCFFYMLPLILRTNV